jgi:hypothetical protein
MMKPIGFEKRTDGCWWILEDKDGAVSRRSMSPLQYEILAARLMADWLEDERRYAGYGISADGIARMARESIVKGVHRG